jgi:hypothetical protein
VAQRYSRLAKYDRRAARLARLTHALSFAHWYGIALIAAIFCATSGGLLFGTDASTVKTIAASTITIAATLGGLSTTIFFLTAQLKVGGIAQYGLTELYRLRDHLPLMLTTMSAIVFGFISLISAPCDVQTCVSFPGVLWIDRVVIDPNRQFAMLALLTIGLLMLMSIILGLTLISNLEPVTVARRYAMRVDQGDAVEWGLFTMTFSDTPGHETQVARYQLVSNRRNFGLRDPIMPIHELVETAPNQRFGQLIGVMLARVVTEYGLKWKSQAPDVDDWTWEPTTARRNLEPSHPTDIRAVEREQQRARGRFSLAILMIHYARRIPLNNKCETPRDVRRQSVQFQMCRLVATLADSKNPPHDIDDVIDLALNAVLHVSVDAQKTDPHGKSESLWALAAAARVLHDSGRIKQALSSVDILAWCSAHTRQISGVRETAVLDNLRAGDPELLARFTKRRALYGKKSATKLPTVGKCDPWNADTQARS